MADTYPYEQLDGQSFQRLAQALILVDHPRSQCFPLLGPDGGRDAVNMDVPQGQNAFADSIVFQVKFREPNPLGAPTSDDLFDWLTTALKREKPKLVALARAGAREYVIITNIPASGHLHRGLRDRMQAWISKNMPLPTRAWWRADIDSRLAKQSDLVFKFNLFNGVDAVRAFLEEVVAAPSSPNEAIRRTAREPAITSLLAYLGEQYRKESVLRFEQADLPSSPLLDFFVDVPARPDRNDEEDSECMEAWYKTALAASASRTNQAINDLRSEGNSYKESLMHDWNESQFVGAADFLLHEEPALVTKKIVLEGAPGQGKSTLGQYLCQIHRARILQRSEDLEKAPAHHMNSVLRLPLKIDLRHLAKWFARESPWGQIKKNEIQNWAPSIESFLAAHIRQETGGMSFSPDDLASVLSTTPTIVIFDGLDEVPDVELRANIVNSIEGSVTRWEAIGADVQVLVTSRPAEFSKATNALGGTGFFHMSLMDLPELLISTYSESWIRMRDLLPEQAAELQLVLFTNLEEPHFRDLARNPMQLAILLWLIHVKGWSLPDQRTPLYEAYLTTFLDREAKKNSSVRKYRKELLELHGFLGWFLHARSESTDEAEFTAGDIAKTELLDLLRQYLLNEERSTEIVDDLFVGVQRVFVIVSRIEDRYEFEVQPLREFFAARYLYKTAQHSTAGFPASGTRPDRLEALIRNPYWQNVTRFFCGWYDKGELADLTRRLMDLIEDPVFGLTSYPRILVSNLLSDYVTVESRRDTRALAKHSMDSLGMRIFSGCWPFPYHSSTSTDLALPDDSGLDSLVENARTKLVNAELDDHIHEAGSILSASDKNRGSWWASQIDIFPNRSEWLRRGAIARCISELREETAISIFGGNPLSAIDAIRLLEGGRLDVALTDPSLMDGMVHALGEGTPVLEVGENPSKEAIFLSDLSIFLSFQTIKRLTKWGRLPPKMGRADKFFLNEKTSAAPDQARRLNDLMRFFDSLERPSASNSFALVANVSEQIIETLGPCWAAWRTALHAFDVDPTIDLDDAPSLDVGTSLARKVRGAYTAGANREYWISLVSEDPIPSERRAVSAIALAWAPRKYLPEILGRMAGWWDQLELWEVISLRRFIPSLIDLEGSARSKHRMLSENDVRSVSRDIPASLVALLLARCNRSLRGSIVQAMYDSRRFPAHEPFVQTEFVAMILVTMTKKPGWAPMLQELKACYKGSIYGGDALIGTPSAGALLRYPNRITKEVIARVLGDPEAYPRPLVAAADIAATAIAMNGLKTIRRISIDDNWFVNEVV